MRVRAAGGGVRRALAMAVACLLLGAGESEARDLPLQVAQASAPPTAGQPDPTAPIVQGQYWALVVGINAYPNLTPAEQLTAAVPGAEAVARVLRQYGVERERIAALYDARASRARVLEALEGSFRREVAPGDSIFIYFAGHCRVSGTTKEVWWLPADARSNDPASHLALDEILLALTQVPARHVLVVADACLGEGVLGTSRISGDPTIREVYQRRSRWAMTAGVSAPLPEDGGAGSALSPFTRVFVEILRDQQLPFLTPLHLRLEMAERLSPGARATVQSGPLTGLGDEDGQFVFRLEGASPPAIEARVPAKEDPRVANLRQYIDVGQSLNLPPTIKTEVLADLQGQVDALQREIQETRRRQEEAGRKRIETWRARGGR